MPAFTAAALRGFWSGLRELTGDDAYDRYLARHAATHAAMPPLDREAFYIGELERKWSGVNRCC